MDTLDLFCHWAPRAYCEAALRGSARSPHMLERALAMPVMTDLDARLRLMDRFPGYRQVPCLVSPPLETIATPEQAAELARLANDGMAAMAACHPNRFPSFFASLAMNNPDAMLAEARRAVTQLGARGVQVFTSINGGPLDAPPAMELFALMAELGRPVLLHPILGMDTADYDGESYSKHELWWALGWPYETSKAMYRLAFAGVFDRWPGLKIITHHGGGLIPMAEGRLGAGLEAYGSRTPPEWREKENTPLRGEPLAAFRRFYTDTATFGSAVGIECALQFFGAERVLFATDMPFGPEQGAWHVRQTLDAIATLALSRAQKRDVLSGNAERMLRLGQQDDGSTVATNSKAIGVREEGPAVQVKASDAGTRTARERKPPPMSEDIPIVEPWKKIEFDPFWGGAWLVAGDVDGDGEVEVITARITNENDNHATCSVSAWKLDGSMLWRWGGPGAGQGMIWGDVACQVYDWDGDGCLEVIASESRHLVVLDGATGIERRRLSLPNPWAALSDCMVFCDLRGTGRREDVLVKSRYERIFALDPDWNLLWGCEFPAGGRTAHQPLASDIDGDGHDEVMVGAVMLNSDGSERFRIQAEEEELLKGHLDCARVLNASPNPEEVRIAFTYCGTFLLGMLDGTGRILWSHRGRHFESIDLGHVIPGETEPQLVVDVDKEPSGNSPLLVFGSDGRPLHEFTTPNSRHHDLIGWRAGPEEDILVGSKPTIYSGAGEPLATFATDPFDQIGSCFAWDMNGDGRQDVVLSTRYGTAAYIFANPGLCAPRPELPLGTGVNHTLY